jgi:hypothetical protein
MSKDKKYIEDLFSKIKLRKHDFLFGTSTPLGPSAHRTVHARNPSKHKRAPTTMGEPNDEFRPT